MTPTVKQHVVEIPAYLLTPFPIEEAGETVGSLSEGYIANTIQLGNANKRLEIIREWNESQRKIYGNMEK